MCFIFLDIFLSWECSSWYFYWLQFQILRPRINSECFPGGQRDTPTALWSRFAIGRCRYGDAGRTACFPPFFLLLGAAVIAAYGWKFERRRPSISSCKQGNPPALLCMSSQRSSRVRIVNTLPCGFYIGLPRARVRACVMVSAGPLASASLNNSLVSFSSQTNLVFIDGGFVEQAQRQLWFYWCPVFFTRAHKPTCTRFYLPATNLPASLGLICPNLTFT